MSFRKACSMVATIPVFLVSCTDLSGLSQPQADGGAPDPADGGGAALDRCPPGQKSCNGGCVAKNLIEYGCASDSCDRCSVFGAETTICEDGKCAFGTCQQGRGSCDGNKENGCEANFSTAATCGGCGAACATATPLCDTGQCVKDCGAGQTQCGSQCVNLLSAADNCGACGKACPAAANAIGICTAGSCAIKCNSGFGQCDKNVANGCESLLPYYTDGDSDGVGAGAKAGEACSAPAGTALATGDCLDTDGRVRPGQATFFATGYTNAAGQTSYDFDCNGKEDNEPGKIGAPECGAGCKVGAYRPAPRPTPPPIANYYCGSIDQITLCSTSCSYMPASAVGCR